MDPVEPVELVARLSPREQQVLELIADGCTNDAIAARLHVSVKTVEVVCGTVFRKLDLVDRPTMNRRVLAARLYERAVVPTAPAPRYGNRFVGRDGEVTLVRELVTDGRLVIVVGPGGIGKTRLVAEAVAGCPGVWWIDLTAARSIESAWLSTYRAFGIAAARPATSRRLLAQRLDDGPSVVVVDNADSCVGGANEIVSTLRQVGGGAIIVTSRVRLDLDGETVAIVGPLRDRDAAASLAARVIERGAAECVRPPADARLARTFQ